MPATRSISLLLITAGIVSLLTRPLEASVKGREFAGGFVTNLGFPAVCTLSFGNDGVLTQWEYGVLFGGTYTGEYLEVELGNISYWRSVVADESPNGYATFSGFCLFGLVTTFHNQNLDQLITADGWLVYTGSVP
jgi:hypothetical protein